MKLITISISDENLRILREMSDSDMSVDDMITVIIEEFIEAQDL